MSDKVLKQIVAKYADTVFYKYACYNFYNRNGRELGYYTRLWNTFEVTLSKQQENYLANNIDIVRDHLFAIDFDTKAYQKKRLDIVRSLSIQRAMQLNEMRGVK